MKEYAAGHRLWAVTSYFNPVGYRRRRENYRVFRERLAVPLVAVELSFTGQFELEPADAEILVQIHGRDVMWQKERLLNVAVSALPSECTEVAVLDCDVVFVRPDWPQAASRALARFPLIQPFAVVHYTGPNTPCDSPAALAGGYTRPSVATLLEQGGDAAQIMHKFTGRENGIRAPGHAIAARRELLATHGLYDAGIMGSGDTSLMAAALGLFDSVMDYQLLNSYQRAWYLDWARPFAATVGGKVGCSGGELIHLWHGDITDRGTFTRHRGFAGFLFNPAEDIALEPSGCWRWNSAKPHMHRYVRDYFASRWEDGRVAPNEGPRSPAQTPLAAA